MLYINSEQIKFFKSKMMLRSEITYLLTEKEAIYINNNMHYYCNYELIPSSDITFQHRKMNKLIKPCKFILKNKQPPISMTPKQNIQNELIQQPQHIIEPIEQIQSIQSYQPIQLTKKKKISESPLMPPTNLSSQVENQRKFEEILKKGIKYQESLEKKKKKEKPKSKTKQKMNPAKTEEQKVVIKMANDFIQQATGKFDDSGDGGLLRKSELERIYKAFCILIDMKSDKRNRKREKKKKISERREELFIKIKKLTLDQVREIAKILQPMNDNDTLYINVNQITSKNVNLIEKSIKAFGEDNKKVANLVTYEQLTNQIEKEKEKDIVKFEPIDIINDSLSSSLSDSDSDSNSIDSEKSKKINALKDIMKEPFNEKKKD